MIIHGIYLSPTSYLCLCFTKRWGQPSSYFPYPSVNNVAADNGICSIISPGRRAAASHFSRYLSASKTNITSMRENPAPSTTPCLTLPISVANPIQQPFPKYDRNSPNITNQYICLAFAAWRERNNCSLCPMQMTWECSHPTAKGCKWAQRFCWGEKVLVAVCVKQLINLGCMWSI